MAEPEEPAAAAGGEGFLARWSRLKRAAREEAAPSQAPSPPSAPATAEGEAVAAETGENEAIDLTLLPKLEDITAETNLGLFFRKGVPAALRNAALRRAWSLDPTIRDFIGPADYAWDWNTPGGVPDFLDGVGETPAIRAVVERMFAPAAAEDAGAAEEARLAAAQDRPPAASPDASASPPGAPAAPGEEGTMPSAAPASVAADDGGRSTGFEGPASIEVPSRARHGGALPG